jgi:NAD(P)H-hydrate epimerase
MLQGKTLPVAAVREADRRCIEDLGIPSAVLMETAGRAVFGQVREGPVGVVCGKGNNGGDGFVVARTALAAGMETHVWLTAEPGKLTGDAACYAGVYRRIGGEITPLTREADVPKALQQMSQCKTLVDALLGTGITGMVRGIYRPIIEDWPEDPRTIAVDVPSGLDADTGKPCGCAVQAAVTVTFQYAKLGYSEPSAAPYLGRLEIADIGIPPVCADDKAWEALAAQW